MIQRKEDYQNRTEAKHQIARVYEKTVNSYTDLNRKLAVRPMNRYNALCIRIFLFESVFQEH